MHFIPHRRVGSLGSVVFFAGLLAGCGGGGSAPAQPATLPEVGASGYALPPTYVKPSLAGIYDVNYSSFRGLYTLLDDGRFSGIHYAGDFDILGHPHAQLNADNSLARPQDIPWANFQDTSYGTIGHQETNTAFGRELQGDLLQFYIRGSMGGYTAASDMQRPWGDGSSHTLYFDPLPLTVLAGTYSGRSRAVGINMIGQDISDFVIAADGSFSVTSGACRLAGTLRQYKNTGVYDANAVASGAGCGFTAPLSGLLTPISYDGHVPRLGLQLDTPDNQQSTVYVVRRNP
ncbi:MAG: hypothetical protein ACXU8N_14315 [Telluria sp.]